MNEKTPWRMATPPSKVDEKFQAVVINTKENHVEITNLKCAEDGYYLDDGPFELDYNFHVLCWRPIKPSNKDDSK